MEKLNEKSWAPVRRLQLPIERGNRNYRVSTWRDHAHALILISGPNPQIDAPGIAAQVYSHFLGDLDNDKDPKGFCRARVITFDGRKLRWMRFIRKGERFEQALFITPLPSDDEELQQLGVYEQTRIDAAALKWNWPIRN